jgi:putative membrane protein
MRWCALLGLAVLCAAWIGPLPALSRQAFSAHMSIHMLVVAVAAPLLALGMSGSRFDPVRAGSRLFAPIPASFIELAIVWLWHAPALHHAARLHGTIFWFEQTTFLASGLLLWMSVLGGGSLRTANRAGSGIVALLLTSMHMTLLGALLALSPRPLYSHAPAGPLTPLADQHLGGAIMLVAGGLSYLVGGVGLTIVLFRGTPRTRTERT